MQQIFKESINGKVTSFTYDDSMIKESCAICEQPFAYIEGEKTEEARRKRYETRGNYCSHCNARCGAQPVWKKVDPEDKPLVHVNRSMSTYEENNW